MKKLFLFLFMLGIGVFQYANAQTVSGIVTDADDGSVIPGVNIQLKGSSGGTITDIDGKYSIDVTGETPVLLFSFIGFQTKEIAVKGQSEINVTLTVETTGLDEVVVVGYGVQKKSLVTGAIAKVSGDELVKGTNLRVTQALQGKTAGVVISNNSGQPGSFVSVRIRGAGTNGDNEPLYVIDGLPNNGYGIDYLAPEDIESIEVLKDAASAAIYGARAANGVILITTKQGKKNGKTEVTYSGWYGTQNPWHKIGVLETDNYVMINNEASINAGQGPKFDQAQIDTFANTDWQNEMFNYDAPKMSHSISLTGGSKKFAYSSSLTYFTQEGIIAKGNSDFERINYRLNTVGDFGMMTIGTNLNYANMKNKGISANDQFAGDALIQALNSAPIVAVHLPDGNWGTPEKYGIAMQEITNPLAILSFRNNETKIHKVVAGIYAEFDLGQLVKTVDGLKFKTTYGTEYALVTSNAYTPIYDLDATHKSLVNRVNTSMHQYVKWNFENILTYTKSFGNHNLSALLGHSAFKESNQNIGGSKTDVIFDEFDKAYINNATDPLSMNIYGGYGEHTLLSYFGRVNYDLMDKYMLTAIVRADGSSRFGAANKFGYFPSVSAGWIFSKESFMSSTESIMNFAKIRASWGQNGNENIGDFRYTSVMSNSQIYYFGANKTQYNGVIPSSISNPNLKWETSEQINVGLDLQFLQNMISLTADYYIKTTKDWLVQAPAPLTLGNVPPVINGGDVENSGFEFELGYHQKFGNFKVNVSIVGAYNKNEVLDIKNEEKKLSSGTGGFGQSGILVAEVGKPMGYFSGYQTNGIFQNTTETDAFAATQPNAVPGDVRFVDQNGDGVLDNDDRVMLGDPNPDFTGGININLDWKGIDFNMFWYSAMGHQIWNATRRYDMNYANYSYSVLNRWTGEGTSNEQPRVTYNDLNNNWKTASDLFVEDADFIRLRNVSLGYTLPKNIVNYAKISRFRIYVAAENLFTFTKYSGYEPEIGGGVFGHGIDHGVYPQARTFLGGINITF